MKKITRKIILACWLTAIGCGIAFLFWHNEWKFNLPTPVPANYHAVMPGTLINIPAISGLKPGRPVLLHFFNPDCPCSRFNLTHFKSLLKKYGSRISFAVVVINKNKRFTEQYIRQKYELDIPISFNQSIADSCGVYSTPQAAIIDAAHKLYYRGNYNKNRYCTNPGSNFAQMAIDSLLQQQPLPVLNAAAFKSYGCQLPNCKK